MGNTSDRVAGERHGAKAHRSDSGGHKDHEPSSKMVDSTDDPNIFNTHGSESKVLLQNTKGLLCLSGFFAICLTSITLNSSCSQCHLTGFRLRERRNLLQIWMIW